METSYLTRRPVRPLAPVAGEGLQPQRRPGLPGLLHRRQCQAGKRCIPQRTAPPGPQMAQKAGGRPGQNLRWSVSPAEPRGAAAEAAGWAGGRHAPVHGVCPFPCLGISGTPGPQRLPARNPAVCVKSVPGLHACPSLLIKCVCMYLFIYVYVYVQVHFS